MIKATGLRGSSVFQSFRFPVPGVALGLLPFMMSLGSFNVRAQPALFPDVSVEGTVRVRAEKELLLQTNTDKVLRFRLLAGTEFRARDGKPFRDSLIHPGDRIVVDVNSGDVETAINVIFISSASSSARGSALLPVDSARVVVPELSDFHSGPGPAGSNSEKAAPAPVHPAPQTAERKVVVPAPLAEPTLETTPQKIVKDLDLGRSLLFRNRPDSVSHLKRAAEGCDAAHSVSPDCAEAYVLLGFVLYDGKHLETLREKSEPLYRKAIAIYENGPPDKCWQCLLNSKDTL